MVLTQKASGVNLVAFGVFEFGRLLLVLVVDVLAQVVLTLEFLCTERASEGRLAPACMHAVNTRMATQPHTAEIRAGNLQNLLI